MKESVLTDKNQVPSDEIVFSFIGRRKLLWNSLFQYIREQHPDIAHEWRYYNDGNSWLMKVTRKAKTVFWLSVIKGTFRITFYFTDKAQQTIGQCGISKELKDQFKTGKKYNKIRGITILFKYKKDCVDAQELIGIKLLQK
ncbi:MAG: DUF3788 family protein [Ignavibacteriae bacterium]|nr:MAG: DUF3788 family protein [Ignavibacteriota bacterium]